MAKFRHPNDLDMSMTRHDLRSFCMLALGLLCGGVTALGLHHL
jgi:hypothetical protein